MVCIYCSQSTQVTNSRRNRRQNQVWRRRSCLNCGASFTTTEIPLLSKSIMVKGVTGELHGFSFETLFLSIYDSIKHRENSIEDAKHLTETITSKLLGIGPVGTISTSHISETAKVCLSRFDKLAAAHYSAYHE